MGMGRLSMNPEIIIDGHNLLHRASDLREIMGRNPEEAREVLIHKLNLLRSGKRIKISLVFDGDRVGQPSRQNVGGISVTYSIKPVTADTLIKRMLQKHENPANVLVVSSDNSILQYAKTYRAQVLRSEEFYRKHLGVKAKPDEDGKQADMSKAELAQWMKIFNQTDENE